MNRRFLRRTAPALVALLGILLAPTASVAAPQDPARARAAPDAPAPAQRVQPPDAWQRQLALRATNLSPADRQTAIDGLTDDLRPIFDDCDVWCYWWGPGCPCYEDDWLEGPQPIIPIVVGLAAGILFDVAQCAIRIEIDGYEKGEQNPLEGEKGFDRLVNCAFGSTGTISAGPGTWTAWLNRDNPSGTGDFETLADFRKNGQVCTNPKQIQCRLRVSKQLVKTGLVNGREQYVCDVATGGVCDNRRQSPGVRCSDYEVRFLCP